MLSNERFMRVAITLARRGQGNVAPNPSVGCVIVNGGNIVGRGWTQPGGRPHAETEALKRAGVRAVGATAYITLEPCAHQGKTQPCAQALIDAKISRAVLGPRDPDPRVDGAGIKMLKAAGIDVIEGVCQDDAESVAAGFFKKVHSKRPLVTLKIATTLDGKIATAVGESRWITGEESRAIGHGMRARHDAVLIGGRTVLVDNPALTCRLPGLDAHSPVRVILDGNDEIPRTHTLLKTADEVSTWIVVPNNISNERRARYIDAGVDVIDVAPISGGKPNLEQALSALGERGITRLMVEGGGRIMAAFMRCRLADFLVWFRTPMVIGADGIPAIAALGLQKLDEAPNFVKLSTRFAGDDVVETYALSR